MTVSKEIHNDDIALEADEVVNIDLTIDPPVSGVTTGAIDSTVVTITDDDSKFSIERQVFFWFSVCHDTYFLCSLRTECLFQQVRRHSQ